MPSSAGPSGMISTNICALSSSVSGCLSWISTPSIPTSASVQITISSASVFVLSVKRFHFIFYISLCCIHIYGFSFQSVACFLFSRKRALLLIYTNTEKKERGILCLFPVLCSFIPQTFPLLSHGNLFSSFLFFQIFRKSRLYCLLPDGCRMPHQKPPKLSLPPH